MTQNAHPYHSDVKITKSYSGTKSIVNYLLKYVYYFYIFPNFTKKFSVCRVSDIHVTAEEKAKYRGKLKEHYPEANRRAPLEILNQLKLQEIAPVNRSRYSIDTERFEIKLKNHSTSRFSRFIYTYNY